MELGPSPEGPSSPMPTVAGLCLENTTAAVGRRGGAYSCSYSPSHIIQVPSTCARKFAEEVLRPDRQSIKPYGAHRPVSRQMSCATICFRACTASLCRLATPANGVPSFFFSLFFSPVSAPPKHAKPLWDTPHSNQGFFFCLSPPIFFSACACPFFLPPSSLFSQFLLPSHKLLHPLFSHTSSPLSPNPSPPSLYTRHLSLVFPLKTLCVCF